MEFDTIKEYLDNIAEHEFNVMQSLKERAMSLMERESDFLYFKNKNQEFNNKQKQDSPFDYMSFDAILSEECELTHNIAKMLFTTNIQSFVSPQRITLNKLMWADKELKDYYYILTKSKIHPNKKFSEDFILSVCDFFDAKYNEAARRVILHSISVQDLMLDDTYYHSMKKESREKVIQFLLNHPNYQMNKKKNVSSAEETSLML